MEEYFDVLDENGYKTGQVKPRSAVHRDGDWHAAINVFIINERDEILQQRRAPNKDSYPNMWDLSCGGHVVTGEDFLTAAARELNEELGIKINPQNLKFLGQFKTNSRPKPDFINNSIENVYVLDTTKGISDFKIQKEEISEIRYIHWQKLKKMLENPHPSNMLRHQNQYDALFRYLKK